MKKILVIEDDPAISLGLAMFLKGENFDVIKSDDGRLGYELALREKPEIIILDVNLPSMDGIQVCRMLRENGFQNPVIILTSKAEKIDKVVGLEIGADDYVTKPFDSRELLARIRTNLRRIENTQSNFSVSDDKNFNAIYWL
ncbi:MAG: response regulator transcription factor [Ignavibacteriaceae bacterium]|nr:response regulator transcription factor [Ignavibacteriaceae bacterium]